jgi:hypothetical protein
MVVPSLATEVFLAKSQRRKDAKKESKDRISLDFLCAFAPLRETCFPSFVGHVSVRLMKRIVARRMEKARGMLSRAAARTLKIATPPAADERSGLVSAAGAGKL